MKKIILIIAVLVLVTVGIIFLIKGRNSGPTYNEQSPKQAETGGQKQIAFENFQALAKILLSQQFIAVRNEINQYVIDNYKDADRATINGAPKVLDNGNVVFTLEVPKQNPLTIVLDRSDNNTIGFLIQESGYNKKIVVYGAPTGD